MSILSLRICEQQAAESSSETRSDGSTIPTHHPLEVADYIISTMKEVGNRARAKKTSSTTKFISGVKLASVEKASRFGIK